MSAAGLTLGLVPHGAVYLICPEHDAVARRRDLEGIRRLGFNTVVLWPPASRWDAPLPGGLAFDSIDDAMDVCSELGLRVIIELQGQDDNHGPIPEYLPFAHEWPNINHPEIRAATLEFMREVARHFRGHEALLGYCTFNEVHFTKADEWALAEFVHFLRAQYAGDIRALNAAWCTFHREFEEIPRHGNDFRRRVWSSGLMQRDWFRFQQHNFAARLRQWRSAIREEDPDVVIFADILGCDTMHNRTQYGSNDWLTAAAGDIHGLSCYANMLGEDWRERDAFGWAQFWRQQVSAAGGKQTVISELMTHNRTMFPAERSSMVDQLGLWSHQAFFNGVRGLIYWKYRPFIRGLQVSGRGLTNYEAEPGHLSEQAARAAAFSAQYADLLATSTPDHAGAAILHDHDAQDLYSSIQSWDPSFYVEAHRGIFRGFWEHGISPRYVTPRDLESGVPRDVTVLAIPCDVCLSEPTARALVAFVTAGGTLFTEGRFGLLTPDGYLHARVPGFGVREALGVGEAHFTSDARDRVRWTQGQSTGDGATTEGSAGGRAELVIDDYLQILELEGGASPLLSSERGRVVIAQSRVGAGMYVHAAILLGRAIHRGTPGALHVFAKVFEHIRSALRPAVAVHHKPPMVDVSVLVDKTGRPAMIGICNYALDASRVELALDARPRSAVAHQDVRSERIANGFAVDVPPREVLALLV